MKNITFYLIVLCFSIISCKTDNSQKKPNQRKVNVDSIKAEPDSTIIEKSLTKLFQIRFNKQGLFPDEIEPITPEEGLEMESLDEKINYEVNQNNSNANFIHEVNFDNKNFGPFKSNDLYNFLVSNDSISLPYLYIEFGFNSKIKHPSKAGNFFKDQKIRILKLDSQYNHSQKVFDGMPLDFSTQKKYLKESYSLLYKAGIKYYSSDNYGGVKFRISKSIKWFVDNNFHNKNTNLYIKQYFDADTSSTGAIKFYTTAIITNNSGKIKDDLSKSFIYGNRGQTCCQ